jgi:very-short-patch-repair endonuclease
MPDIEKDYPVSARELMGKYGYVQWRNFEGVIKRAIELIEYKHLDGVITKTQKNIKIGNGVNRPVVDYLLDRGGERILYELCSSYKLCNVYSIRNETLVLQLISKYCKINNIGFEYQFRDGGYVFDCKVGSNILIEFDEPHHQTSSRQMNIDSDKDVYAKKMGYTMYRVTLSMDIVDIITFLEPRLSMVSNMSGIDNPKDYAIFQNKGYQGLYNGLGVKDIHKRKGLDINQKILDHMGSTELAANLFRATQTDDKLRRENIRGKENANKTHFVVGKKVRQTIKELGGTMPEDLELPEKSIKEIEEKPKKRLLQGESE